jgi:hypothetical protein
MVAHFHWNNHLGFQNIYKTPASIDRGFGIIVKEIGKNYEEEEEEITEVFITQ